MTPSRREIVIWAGGALLIVAGVVAWLLLSRPEENLLPQQYSYGVL